ncbi:phospholipase D-like domain-containing protein [Microvirga sp. GCM10011540]|uniref:phospholipase D-like domain-containing protein n=1 Tax=Microvirga sp. GCM10011540 TaxID=3317338 RepID=UPI00360D491A
MQLSNHTRDYLDIHQRVGGDSGFEWKILKPGQNCWRVPACQRAAALIDGASYFSRLEAMLREARRSILILGWDFDGSIRLRPDACPEDSPPLGPLLRSLLEDEPELEIRILVWSLATIHAPSAPAPLLLGTEWQDHPRLHLRLDAHHPIYAAHHQKIVCIDDAVAFVGGMDLTIERWDTMRHAVDDPHRVRSDSQPYCPVHDIQMVVDGEAAKSVAELARWRWAAATGETLAPVHSREELWPADLAPDFADVPVAIARTIPAWDGEAAVEEVATLTADALSAARETIYIEAQYMTAPYVGKILASHLSRFDGPEVVIVMTYESHGLAERLVMGSNRDRLIRRLKNADRYDRLRIYYPCVSTPSGEHRQVLVHSKLIIIDDCFLRIGSSNLNNRSIGLDTECDLAIEASESSTRQGIAKLREQLLAEHLDVHPELLASTMEAEKSLIRAIEALNHRPRCLRPFEAMFTRGPSRPALGTHLLDPEKPFEPLWFLRSKR